MLPPMMPDAFIIAYFCIFVKSLELVGNMVYTEARRIRGSSARTEFPPPGWGRTEEVVAKDMSFHVTKFDGERRRTASSQEASGTLVLSPLIVGFFFCSLQDHLHEQEQDVPWVRSPPNLTLP